MVVIIFNTSKKKSFRGSKRIIAMVLQPITNRVAIGDIPKRILIKLMKDLKQNVTRGTSLQIFFESKNLGFRGFKCVQIGIKRKHLDEFMFSKSLIDNDLILNKLNPYFDP